MTKEPMEGVGDALTVINLGRIAYDEALKWQLDWLHWRRGGSAGDALFFAEHDPVVTLGRATTPEDMPDPRELAARGIEIREASRGGKATYHGPGQLVGYPVIALKDRGLDLHSYVQSIETALIGAIAELGVAAGARHGLRGVWVEARKIAAIGVAVKHWISYHGFSVNCGDVRDPFSLITPCGLPGGEVTSLFAEAGRTVTLQDAAETVTRAFAEQFGYTDVRRRPHPGESRAADR